MAEYIEREALINIIKERNGRVPDWVEECISDCPKVADVRPERHGEWAGTVCTACGASVSFYYDCNYCPICGAEMDGERNG